MSINNKFTMKINSDIEKKIEHIGLNYLSRFETSEKQFLDFLRKKLFDKNFTLNKNEKENLIKNILTKMKKLNYVNDIRYSNLKSNQIFNSGGSQKMIKAKLMAKGIPENIIKNSLEILLNNDKNEFFAALIYLKKRRIGVFFSKKINKNNHAELKKKWFGALARRGFSFEIAKEVLNIEDQLNAENIINRMKI